MCDPSGEAEHESSPASAETSSVMVPPPVCQPWPRVSMLKWAQPAWAQMVLVRVAAASRVADTE